MQKMIIKYIENRYKIGKRKTFNLAELESYLIQKLGGVTSYSNKGGYETLFQVMNNLNKEGFIIAVKNSPLNGKNPPLKIRWRIQMENKQTGWSSRRFFQFSDRLNLSFYQRNPEHQTEDEWQKIEAIYSFLKDREKREWASLEERSLELFDDEKFLYDSSNKAVLNRLKLSLVDLKAKKYGEMFIYWRKSWNRKTLNSRGLKVLILENHSTFFSSKRILQEGKDILGEFYDMLIFGQGKKIIKSLSFLNEIITHDEIDNHSKNIEPDLINTTDKNPAPGEITIPEDIEILYFGDIDPEGFLIYRLLKERYGEYDIKLCLQLYSELLQAAERFYPCDNQRRDERDLQFVLDEFIAGNYIEEAEKTKELWYNDKRIPQELITYEYLIN